MYFAGPRDQGETKGTLTYGRVWYLPDCSHAGTVLVDSCLRLQIYLSIYAAVCISAMAAV